MPVEWPVEIGDEEFHPVPESWITAPTAYDYDDDAPPDAVRLYAVSAALLGTRSFRVRYAHPGGTKVLTLETPAVECNNGDGYYPNGLRTGRGWPRSYVPTAGRGPDDITRQPESRYLRELWGQRVPEIPTEEETRRLLCEECGVAGRVFDA